MRHLPSDIDEFSALAGASGGSAPLVLSMGDPCGIGPEIVAMQWLASQAPRAVVVGSVAVMRRAVAALQAGHPRAASLVVWAVRTEPPPPVGGGAASQASSIIVPVWEPEGLPAGLEALPWGQVNAQAGAAAALCVREGAALVQQGRALALVTAPLHKESLSLAGETFPGHTELLQALATPQGQPLLPVRMMLANHELRTVLVSIHVSLRQALDAVTFDNVLATVRITHQSFRKMGFERPRIAVAGLNPHAGEGGLFGDEELRVIIPALETARAEGVDVTGPLAPDTVFMRARHAPPEHPGEFDVVVAMYHDQGLIPVKYLGVAHGVNVTLGLPFVRTSPDHGTAFDLAGTGRADPSSLTEAMRVARQLAASG
jgi:4-hydroxythreonine-4-phosphate dehydrogenase